MDSFNWVQWPAVKTYKVVFVASRSRKFPVHVQGEPNCEPICIPGW